MVFYKYCGDSGIRIIEDLRLKITPPSEFNDPFELTSRSKFAITKEYMIARLKDAPDFYRPVFEDMQRDGYPHDFHTFMQELPAQIRFHFSEFRRRMVAALENRDMHALNEASQKFGVFCVSKVATSICMWSHYGNEHTGIAVGLNMRNIGKAYGPFDRVKYRKSRHAINQWIDRKSPQWFNDILDTFFTKSKDWSYEREFRRIFQLKELMCSPIDKDGKRHYFYDIRGADLLEVIFGCRINSTYEMQVRKALLRRPETFGHVKLYRCKRHGTRFELECTPC